MRARVIAWAVVAVTAVAVVADTVVTASYQSLLAEHTWAVHGWPLVTVSTIGYAAMGALILSRYPRHAIGWLLLVPALTGLSLVAESYSFWVLDHDGPGPETAGHVAAWVSLLVGGQVAIAALSLIFLLSPDGHLPSRRWRWAARTSVAGVVVFVAGLSTIPPAEFELSRDEDVNTLTGVLGAVGFFLIGAGLVASTVGLVVRLRRSRDDVRRQLLWIAASAAFSVVAFVWYVAVQAVQQREEQSLLAAIPLFAAFLLIPICTAVAVLRHRLFDIDLIVNRALVVAIATGLVATGYVLLVVIIGAAVGEGTGGFWPSLLATAVVALAFQPLRRWVVRVADRLAYGASAAPYEALADFSRRLGESPDPTALLPAIADTAGTAVGARRASARLTLPGGSDHVARWPRGSADGDLTNGVEVPVVDDGERLGVISVEMPPGRPLRPGDAQLLRDLADQAGIAFRNARLSAELANRVDDLDRRTHELAESRRRLITAGDAERARVERSIAQRVVPHLTNLPVELDRLAASGPDGRQRARLGPLVAASATALEELRAITRGVYPTQLSRAGLVAALISHLGRARARLTLDDSVADRRFDPRVEAAAYFCVSEATRGLEGLVEVSLSAGDGVLRLAFSGRNAGGLTVAQLRDRVEAAGGTVTMRIFGSITVVEVLLSDGDAIDVAPVPTQGERQAVTADHSATSRSGPNADLVT